MERLTYRTDDGSCCFLHCMHCDGDNCQCCNEVDNAAARLAAYEDTGLDPEEVRAALHLVQFFQEMWGPLDDVKHIRELLQAEKDGRVVILPCKAGDKVYRIVDMQSHTIYKNFVREETAQPIGVPYRDIMGSFSLIPLDAFGKTAFLTKEEAEAALKGGAEK